MASRKPVVKKEKTPKLLQLERVLGTTTVHQRSFVASRDLIAYVAGATVVLYCPLTNEQHLLTAPSHKTIASLAFSRCGRFLAVGEQGHQPAAIVWDVATRSILSELKTHKFGVQTLAFSPSGKQLVTIGTAYDGSCVLWDWRSATVQACSKISLTVHDIAWADDGSAFVTAGLRHLKWWFVSAPSASGKCTMEPKSASLQAYRDACFSAVVCAQGMVYTLTTKGMLCAWNLTTRELLKWVEIKMRALALDANDTSLSCAGCDGAVRHFRLGTLEYICTLPRPHALGTDVGGTADPLAAPVAYPDVVATRWLRLGDGSPSTVPVSPSAPSLASPQTTPTIAPAAAHSSSSSSSSSAPLCSLVACMYSDRSLYVWDVADPKAITQLRAHLWHSGAIWDLDVLPPSDGAAAAAAQDTPMAEGAFASVGADGSLRVWNLSGEHTRRNSTAPNDDLLYCVRYELDAAALKVNMDDYESSMPTTGTSAAAGVAGAASAATVAYGAAASAGSAEATASGGGALTATGIRVLRVSPDGRYIATGDRAGNVRVHDTTDMRVVALREAHDAEILSLDYSWPTGPECNRLLLASSSRDRFIHIFDASVPEHTPLCSLNDHTASVTTVRFMDDGSGAENSARLMSCGADKSVFFRSIVPASDNSGALQIVRYHHAVGQGGSNHDLDLDAIDGVGVVAGQNRRLTLYDIESGRSLRQIRFEQDSGELMRVQLDPSAQYAAIACSDRGIRIVDYAAAISGPAPQHQAVVEADITLFGHSEAVTAVRWSHDCRRLISVAADGCIFVWRVDGTVAAQLQKRAAARISARMQITQRATSPTAAVETLPDQENMAPTGTCPVPATADDSFGLFDSADDNTKHAHELAFSVSLLPSWAKNAAAASPGDASGSSLAGVTDLLASVQGTAKKRSAVRGRWAQRAAQAELPVFSMTALEQTAPAADSAVVAVETMRTTAAAIVDATNKVLGPVPAHTAKKDCELTSETAAAPTAAELLAATPTPESNLPAAAAPTKLAQPALAAVAPSSPATIALAAGASAVAPATTDAQLTSSASVLSTALLLEQQLANLCAAVASLSVAEQREIKPSLARMHAQLDSVAEVGHADLLRNYSERLLAAVSASLQKPL